MRHAVYGNNPLTLIHLTLIHTGQTARTQTAKPGAGLWRGLGRWIARHWDLAGVLTLMGSSAAYGVYALTH